MLERRAAGAAGRHRGNQNPLFPLCIHLTNLTYVWSLPVEHRPQITCLYPAQSRSAASAFSSPDLFSRCSWVAVFFCGLVVFTAVYAWRSCHRIFSLRVQTSSIFYFLGAPTLALHQFFFTVPCWLFCQARIYIMCTVVTAALLDKKRRCCTEPRNTQILFVLCIEMSLYIETRL